MTRIEKPKNSKNQKKIKKMAFGKTSQKNDTLRPAKRGSRNAAPHTKKRYFMTCKTRYLFDEFRRHFLVKLASTLCQSPWPFWFKVGDHFDSKLVAILVSTYDTNSHQKSWGLHNVTDALFTRTLGLFVKYRFLFGSEIWFGAKICHQLEQKFAANLDKNLPPTWTKAGHHLDTQLTKNDTLCPAEAYL